MLWYIRKKFLENEFTALTTIKHKNILEVYHIIRTDDCSYVIMEFLPGGSLGLKVRGLGISENQARFWFKQVTEALNFMHIEHKTCHRFINHCNILLDANQNCRLTNFRYAKPMTTNHSMTNLIVGSPGFFPPEMTMKLERYNPFAADAWAMGVLLYYMLNAAYPFKYPGRQNNEGLKAFVDHQLRGCVHRTDLRVAPSSLVQDFIKRCLDPNPETRFTTQQMLDHQWLRNEKRQQV